MSHENSAPGQKVPRNFVPEPFAYREVVELEIDDISNLGAGVGRVNGWVVMVPFALGGERVRARIFRNRKNFSEGDLLEVVRPSPERAAPKCPLFGVCGGCQYQHLEYRAQLEWKRRQVRSLMKRIGGIDCEPLPTRPSPAQYGYRSKLTPHYEKPRGEDFPIGFVKAGRRSELVDVPHCPIASGAINAALPAARGALRARKGSLRRGGTLLLRDAGGKVCLDNAATVRERVGSLEFEFVAGAQVGARRRPALPDSFRSNKRRAPRRARRSAGAQRLPAARGHAPAARRRGQSLPRQRRDSARARRESRI